MRSPADQITIASILDTALDVGRMSDDAHEYARTREEKLLKTVPGVKVTYFTLKAVDSNTFANTIQSAPTQGERCRRAFAFGVVKITDIVLMDGSEHPVLVPDQQFVSPMSGAISFWSDRDLARIPAPFVEDIGGVVYSRSYLDPKALRAPDYVASYPLQPTVQFHLLGRLAQAAAETARRLRSRRSAERQAEKTGTSPEGGEPAIDAPATGPATGIEESGSPEP